MKSPLDVIAGASHGNGGRIARAHPTRFYLESLLADHILPDARVLGTTSAGEDVMSRMTSRARSGPRGQTKYSLLILLPLLAACSSQPIVRVQYVPTKVYLATPAELTLPVTVDLGDGVTWGQAVGRLNAGLATCNAQISAIKTLTPPPGAL